MLTMPFQAVGVRKAQRFYFKKEAYKAHKEFTCDSSDKKSKNALSLSKVEFTITFRKKCSSHPQTAGGLFISRAKSSTNVIVAWITNLKDNKLR